MIVAGDTSAATVSASPGEEMAGGVIELGAGLNPELSAKENVFLMGALLGFPSDVMQGKLTSIFRFADLEDWAETPIKYYSTGMFQRLAFSIATDVEPEVLLIDEVFAGGDADFVARATARMHELMNRSHVVVMVSHRLPLLKQLMTRVLWIKDGRVLRDGPPEAVIAEYQSWQQQRSAVTRPGVTEGSSSE